MPLKGHFISVVSIYSLCIQLWHACWVFPGKLLADQHVVNTIIMDVNGKVFAGGICLIGYLDAVS